MKRLAAVVFLIASCALPCLAQEPAAPAAPVVPPRPRAETTDITPDQAEKLMAETPGITVLDVRTPEEFQEGHIKGAVNVDINGDDFEKKVKGLDQTKPVLVHCESGRRSARAIGELEGKVKFPQVYHLKSGFKGWKDAKKPVEVKK